MTFSHIHTHLTLLSCTRLHTGVKNMQALYIQPWTPKLFLSWILFLNTFSNEVNVIMLGLMKIALHKNWTCYNGRELPLLQWSKEETKANKVKPFHSFGHFTLFIHTFYLPLCKFSLWILPELWDLMLRFHLTSGISVNITLCIIIQT